MDERLIESLAAAVRAAAALPAIPVQPVAVEVRSPTPNTVVTRDALTYDAPLAQVEPRLLDIEVDFVWPDGSAERDIQRVDEGERRGGTVPLADGDGPVERDHRRRREGEQVVVEGDDLAPVGRRLAVHRLDRGLHLVRTGVAAAQAAPDEVAALLGEVVVPPAAVLVL